MTPEQARKRADQIIIHWRETRPRDPAQADPQLSSLLYWMSRLSDAITAALLDAAKVEPGHVRLPDGRDVRVLGTLPTTTDGAIIGDGCTVWLLSRADDDMVCEIHEATQGNNPDGAPPFRRWWQINGWQSDWSPEIRGVYSTREAAEAVAQEGGA